MSDIQDRLQAAFPTHYRSGKILLLNADCMEVMKHIRDGEFELSCVDPPYGIARFEKGSLRFDKKDEYVGGIKWDKRPEQDYWDELFRISENQIVWGANNFQLPPTEYFCIWDKQQTVDNFATAEYAWVSIGLKKPAKIFKYSIHQHNADHAGGNKIHPTQKPVKLYEWLLTNYAKPGQRILDTHLGSGSSAIACNNLGFEMVGCELDPDYYAAACTRIEQATAQQRLFA